jgi:polyisoprenoid-binding protein YceI
MTVKGHFTRLRAPIDFNEDDFTASSVEATMDAYMLRRDAHLTSADFLDVEQFPTIGVCDSRPVQDDRRPEYPGRYAAGQP